MYVLWIGKMGVIFNFISFVGLLESVYSSLVVFCYLRNYKVIFISVWVVDLFVVFYQLCSEYGVFVIYGLGLMIQG